MVYSSFYFLELNKYNITRNIDLKYFLSRVEARMLWFVLPRVKQLTSCIHTFIVATLN